MTEKGETWHVERRILPYPRPNLVVPEDWCIANDHQVFAYFGDEATATQRCDTLNTLAGEIANLRDADRTLRTALIAAEAEAARYRAALEFYAGDYETGDVAKQALNSPTSEGPERYGASTKTGGRYHVVGETRKGWDGTEYYKAVCGQYLGVRFAFGGQGKRKLCQKCATAVRGGGNE